MSWDTVAGVGGGRSDDLSMGVRLPAYSCDPIPLEVLPHLAESKSIPTLLLFPAQHLPHGSRRMLPPGGQCRPRCGDEDPAGRPCCRRG